MTRDVEMKEEMKIKKVGVKRLGWRVSRRGFVSVGRVDELISCSLCSRMSLPLKALHFYRVWKNNPNVFFSRGMPTLRRGSRRKRALRQSQLKRQSQALHRTGGGGEREESHLCRFWSCSVCLVLVAKMPRHFDLYF